MASLLRLVPLFLLFLIGLVSGTFIVSPAAESPVLLESEAFALNNADLYPFLLLELENAEESVDVVLYQAIYYEDYLDSPSNNLLEALVKAKNKGLRVRVFLDEVASREAVDFLRFNGVNVRIDSKTQTTHSKLVIVDERLVVVGSTNWTFSGLTKNNESNVLIHSPELAREFTAYFNSIWSSS